MHPPLLTALLLLAGTLPLASTEYTGNFIHFTDFHPDPNYLPGSDVRSGCHRYVVNAGSSDTTSVRQNEEDILRNPHRSSEGTAGEFGAPGTKCDAPYTLVNATLAWIGETLMPRVDFVLWTGDSARHDNDRSLPRTEAEIQSSNADLIDRVSQVVPKDIPIIPTIGNNDIYPHNIIFPGPNPTFSHFLSIWRHHIPEDQRHVFLQGGYYIRPIIPDTLHVISLNTIFFYRSNGAVGGCKGGRDPGKEQLRWLKVQLDDARAGGYSIYVIGHVAPNHTLYYKKCFRLYARLALAYRDVLTGQFFGHSNVDHFFFLSPADTIKPLGEAPSDDEDDGIPGLRTAMLAPESHEWIADPADENGPDLDILGLADKKYIRHLHQQYANLDPHSDVYSAIHTTPSVIPTFYPGVRLLHYDPITANLTGWTQFVCNLTRHNIDLSTPTYDIEYSTQKAYGLANMSIQSLRDFALRLSQSKRLWKEYIVRYYVSIGE
jgi:endopolyphosphatase